ncbi:MAG: hypothetical protein JOY62_11150 [Acidobacteriaceae bacterium]|nr:hypothetical protein [Acidobacteriaceae bacterium]MBV9780517.1 hypothetical protein [Acidobacteriaceae bacterium]
MQTIRRIDRLFAVIAARLSSSEFMQFDSYAIWFYAACLFLFLAASLADLNGSSMAIFDSFYRWGGTEKTWIGAPRAQRNDEWAFVTPDIFNQKLRADPFEVKDSAVGGHSVALIANLPVRHFTTLFRPQFWAFFVLRIDYAFAVYWQLKALILLTGVFTWLLLITRSTFWAATGALWYFFSPFTQWSYSWPSALPEMVGSLCFAAVLTCYLTVGRNLVALFLSAAGVVLFVVNFALCAYLPHLIPLIWLAVFFVFSWCLSARKLIFTRASASARMLAIAFALCTLGIVGLSVYRELRPASIAIAQTSYPGRRLFPPADMRLWLPISHFIQWRETENHFPKDIGNMCEGSGFLWLAPATLFCLRRMTLSSMQKFALAALWLFSCLIVAWLLVPESAPLGTLFALNRTEGPRTFPALGLANVSIVALAAASMRKVQTNGWAMTLAYYAGIAAITSAVMYHLLNETNVGLALFFSHREVLFATFFAAALTTLLLSGWKLILAAALVIPQALVFGSVNPIERGTAVFTSSELFKFVRKHPELLHAKWIVFSDSVVNSGFLAATGCNVYTGCHYLPDIDHFPLFAARGLDPPALNRLGYLTAHALPPGEKPSVQFLIPILRLSISPTDPLLPALGIRYVAFDQQPAPALVAGLMPLSAETIPGFWLYRLP